jgi:hypothetical protein
MLGATEFKRMQPASSSEDIACPPPNRAARQRNSPAWLSEVFEDRARPMLRPEDDAKFVALDVQTGDHEVDEVNYAAVTRLRVRNPAAKARLSRFGQRTGYRMRRDNGEPLPLIANCDYGILYH